MTNECFKGPAVAGLEWLWERTLGEPRICIAVLDGPVDLAHPCFAGADLTRSDVVIEDHGGVGPGAAHGTHVASVIFGQHGSAIRGVAPRCRGVVIPIYPSGASGAGLACSQLDLARAIDRASELGAQIINISGGELIQGSSAEPILLQSIRRCTESGILIVAAAGNDGCRCHHAPASVPSVLAVGAVDAAGAPMEFSNWGDAYRGQGLLAPGQDILGAAPGGGTVARTGTSFATPLVAGIAALFLSLQLARGETPDARRIRSLLLRTADPCTLPDPAECARLLAGRLNLRAACREFWKARGGGEPVRGARPSEGPAGFAPATGALRRTVGQVSTVDSLNRILPVGPGRREVMKKLSVPTTTNTEKAMPNENQVSMMPMESAGASTVETNESAISGVLPAGMSGELDAVGTSNGAGELGRRESGMNTVSAVMPSDVEASECASCSAAKRNGASGGAKGGGPSLAYALGQIGVDFGTESRRDSFVQQTGVNIHDLNQLLTYLDRDPSSAANLIWTLSLDATVVYAIHPFGPYASVAYERLREAARSQITEGVERVSVPGYTRGTQRLLNGQNVPVLFPEVRGIYSWSTAKLVDAVIGARPTDSVAAAAHAEKQSEIQNFLERVYYEIRNLGVTPQDRAMNFAATNAFQVEMVYTDALKRELKLDSIDVERSPICRPGSDCWDVKLTFFNPAKRLEQARVLYRFTIDVSDVIPVTVGKVRHWHLY